MIRCKDRRFRRTAAPGVALRYFLEIAAMRLGFKALVLGDGSGELVAGTGCDVDCEIAAKSAPEIFRHEEAYPGHLNEPYFVEALPASTQTYFLVAVGQGSPASLKSSGTLMGIRRIIDE